MTNTGSLGAMTHRRGAEHRPVGARPFPSLLFGLALFAATSRGALETFVQKPVAYGIQVGLLCLFLVALLIRGRPARNRYFGIAVGIGWAFATIALISMFLTLDMAGVDYAGAYVAVMFFFAVILILFSALDFRFTDTRRMAPIIVAVALALMLTAWLQQFTGLTLFPGSDRGTFSSTARPASLTGSFLHYPITLALLSFVLLGIHSVRRNRIYLFTAILGLGSVVASYSRSGMVIVFAGLALGVVLAGGLRSGIRILGALLLAGVVAVTLLPSTDYITRALSIFDIDGAGNVTRRRAWESILNLWLESPLLVGSHTGQYTNVTSNLSSTDAAGVAESGLLQQLISFGLLGALAYYALMILSVSAAPRTPPWFRAGLIAGLIQSLVYQSIEVLPFMVVFAMTPFIGTQIERSIEGLAPPPAAAALTRRRRR